VVDALCLCGNGRVWESRIHVILELETELFAPSSPLPKHSGEPVTRPFAFSWHVCPLSLAGLRHHMWKRTCPGDPPALCAPVCQGEQGLDGPVRRRALVEQPGYNWQEDHGLFFFGTDDGGTIDDQGAIVPEAFTFWIAQLGFRGGH
jgi:hypothetical protein